MIRSADDAISVTMLPVSEGKSSDQRENYYTIESLAISGMMNRSNEGSNRYQQTWMKPDLSFISPPGPGWVQLKVS